MKKLVKLEVDFIWALSYQVECRVVYFYIVLCHKSLLLPIMGLIKSIKHKSYLVAATTHQRRRVQKVRKNIRNQIMTILAHNSKTVHSILMKLDI